MTHWFPCLSCLLYFSLYLYSKIWSHNHNTSNYAFLLRISLAVCSLLLFHVDSQIIFPLVLWIITSDFHVSCIESGNFFFIILTFYGTNFITPRVWSFHHLVFSLLSFINVLKFSLLMFFIPLVNSILNHIEWQ